MVVFILTVNNPNPTPQQQGFSVATSQQMRDSDAELNSYWSTTVRVDTDMNSSWLPEEEKTCQTYPGKDARVAVVNCGSSGNHRIPVRFWGGVDRNKISDWTCRRQKGALSDEFVCRATD